MKTPILFLIYNRPEYIKKVFESIKQARPERLFISADGPKSDDEKDFKLCEEARDACVVDWPCEIKTLFRDKNLGCRLGISGGINWFFEHVEEGIILEDDCLPNESFFNFCENLLLKYRNENKVMMISGSNPAGSVSVDNDYFFSHFYHIWGWATWKRAWKKYDINLSDWPKLKKENFLKKIFPSNLENRLFAERMFDQVYGKDSSVWSIQWTYTCLINNGFAILPKHNLISNIGLIGLHEMNNDQLFLETKSIDFNNFSHPTQLNVNQKAEDFLFEKSGLSKIKTNSV